MCTSPERGQRIPELSLSERQRPAQADRQSGSEQDLLFTVTCERAEVWAIGTRCGILFKDAALLRRRLASVDSPKHQSPCLESEAPKDGPSAGITIATALASLYTARPAGNDTALTGEITLSGMVLPVGGIKEQVLAAHRAGLTCVILPKEDAKDLAELPDYVKSDIEFVFAERIEEVIHNAMVDSLRQTTFAQVC